MKLEKLDKKKWKAKDMSDVAGKIIIVTGANSGIGLEAAKEFAKNGAKVIMACRSLERGNKALADIKEEVPDADAQVMELDLSSLKSIHNFAESFKKEYEKLDILINNAGVMQSSYTETEDGLELLMGVNHFGHFALTGLLLELIKKTPKARIITQSSIMHSRPKTFDFELVNNEEEYEKRKIYSTSKLANLLFTYELDRLFKEHSVDAIAVGVHPGFTATSIIHGESASENDKPSRGIRLASKLIAQNVSMGVLPTLYAATEDDVNGGDYIGCKSRLSRQVRGYPQRLKSSKASHNEEDAKKLWKLSEELTKVQYDM